MQDPRLLQRAQEELRQGQTLPHFGVADRVLQGDDAYPEELKDFEAKLTSEAPKLVETLGKAEAYGQITQQVQALRELRQRLEHGESIDSLGHMLAPYLPYNIQGVSKTLGVETIYKEISYQHYRASVLALFFNYPPQPLTVESFTNAAIAFTRMVYDFQLVLDDVLTAIPRVSSPETEQRTLGQLVKTVGKDQLARMLTGDVPVPTEATEDITTLCGGILRPLHFLAEFQPLVKLPGSVVWSDAALGLLLETTKFRAEAAPVLAELIERGINNTIDRPFSVGDQEIQRLYILGVETLREYYAQHPAQTPIAQILGGDTVTPPAPAEQPAPAPAQPAAPAAPAAEDASWQALEAPAAPSEQTGENTAQPVKVNTPPPKRKISGIDAA
ncbi:hypothetical protein HY374_03575 [Candidatus Berkelbacteria bacterium]|nr:hypothetical protein [Candidatus Berkelbacteria bacterium]